MKASHIELRRLYLQDCEETDKPWERWEIADSYRGWRLLDGEPHWVSNSRYRRKSQTRSINGHEYPAPETVAPMYGRMYYRPSLLNSRHYIGINWINDSDDVEWLKSGLVHLTSEAAITHTKAVILAGGGEV